VSKEPSEEKFLEVNAPLVYNLALRLVGNPADAEDLAQDALLRALKALPKFRGDSLTTTWVYRITVNTWKNRVRSEKRRSFWKTLPLNLFVGDSDEDESGESHIADGAPALDADMEKEETSQAVQAALLKLDEESRAVIILRDLKGMSYQEIAETMSLPEGTVKSRISRARETLKNRLKSFVEFGKRP